MAKRSVHKLITFKKTHKQTLNAYFFPDQWNFVELYKVTDPWISNVSYNAELVRVQNAS